jgi:hypothetical protein
MTIPFEVQLSNVFEILGSSERMPKNNQLPNGYHHTFIFHYGKILVDPEELTKTIITAFKTHKNYLNHEKYYNEPYFFREISNCLESLMTFGSKDKQILYFKAVIDAFDILDKELPELDPGYFHSVFLKNIKSYFINNKNRDILINHYLDKNLVAYEDYPLHISNKIYGERNKNLEESFLKIEMSTAIYNFFKILSESKPEKQHIYKKLMPSNIDRTQIYSFFCLTDNNNHYMAKKIDIIHIEESILLELLGAKGLLSLRNNDYLECNLNTGLNELIKKNVDPEEILDVYFDIIFKNAENSNKYALYGKKLFANEKPFIYLNENHLDTIINYCESNIRSANHNQFFKKLGLYKDPVNFKENIINYFHSQRSEQEKEVLANLLTDHNRKEVKPRL